MPGDAGPSCRIRPARRDDTTAIIRLLADDDLGRSRENTAEPLAPTYFAAFEAIANDDRNILVVAEAADGDILGCLQLTIIPGLSYQGAERALIEDVRVDSRYRNRKIGHRLLNWAVDEARRRNCCLVELFVHETRGDARRFYRGLGFADSHSGMRLKLKP